MLSNILGTIFNAGFLTVAIRLATPILFAAAAAYVSSIAGVMNIAVESIMTFGALGGILGSYLFKSAWLGLLFGLVIGMLVSCLIAFFCMKLGAGVILVGIALNTFADSIAIFILYVLTGEKGTSASLVAPTLGTWDIPIIKDIPVVGQVLSGHYILTYICWVVLIILYIVVFKTAFGMRLRACGLNENAAKTAGVNVGRLQLISLLISGFLAALGGMYLSLNYLKLFSKAMVAGQGWMGIAANGIAQGNFGTLILSSIIFAVFRAMSSAFSTNGAFPVDLVAALPYFAVFVFVTVVSIVEYQRAKKGNTGD